MKGRQILQTMKEKMSKNSPKIFLTLGLIGAVSSVVLAVKYTPKACRLIEARKEELKEEKLTPTETVKTVWKCYIPAAVSGGLAIVCVLASNSINEKRQAALAQAYVFSESAMKLYREKVLETIGEQKEKDVRDKVAKEQIIRDPKRNNEVIITSTGKTLCYDVTSGRYFTSDMESIKQTVNELNRRMLLDEYISLNEFYNELGLRDTSLGDELGWNIGKDGLIEVGFSSQIADDGTPCLVLEYRVPPKYSYRDW